MSKIFSPCPLPKNPDYISLTLSVVLGFLLILEIFSSLTFHVFITKSQKKKKTYNFTNIKSYIPLILTLVHLNYDEWCEILQTHCIWFDVVDSLEEQMKMYRYLCENRLESPVSQHCLFSAPDMKTSKEATHPRTNLVWARLTTEFLWDLFLLRL